MPHPESPHELSPPEEDPDVVSALASIERIETTPLRLTWQEHQAIGDNAYAEAVEREEAYGLDPIALEKYGQAKTHLLGVVATGPIDHVRRESLPADPLNLLKIAGSLAKLAQAPEVEPYKEAASQGIDRRANMQKIAAETLQRASVRLMGDEKHADHAAAIAEFDIETPAEAVVVAAVEAAQETGTSEYATSEYKLGPAIAVDKDTVERLETKGEDAVVRFIGQNALESGPQGLEFVARTAEITIEALEEMTGEHTLPVAA